MSSVDSESEESGVYSIAGSLVTVEDDQDDDPGVCHFPSAASHVASEPYCFLCQRDIPAWPGIRDGNSSGSPWEFSLVARAFLDTPNHNPQFNPRSPGHLSSRRTQSKSSPHCSAPAGSPIRILSAP